MKNFIIKEVYGREILDSRGNPTVEATVTLSDGSKGSAIAPSGASTGEFEAVELRDGDEKRYMGKGVKNAVNNINTIIANKLIGMDADDIYKIDEVMINADGTKDKSRLGANSILAVSIAVVNATAKAYNMPLYKYIGGINARKLPIPMMNILNGGAHANNGLDIQEFMIVPVKELCFKENLRRCVEVFNKLKAILQEENLSCGVGDEGGFAPDIADCETAIEYILKAIERAGYIPGVDFFIALDAAASEWKGKKEGEYILPKTGVSYTGKELIIYWTKLIEKYPIISIEDALDEEDWKGFRELTATLSDKVMLVGDDLFVTNTERLQKGIENNCCNSILIKPNQIGTVSETIQTVKMAQNHGYKAIISHRSGESEDTFIAHLAVGLNAGFIKTGAPSRSERVAKYNELLRIEEDIQEKRV